MLKKVTLTNTNTGKSTTVIVDSPTDEKAILGAGKAPNEAVKVQDISGLDEWLQRNTGKKPTLDERVTLFSGLARCLERNISTMKSLQLMAGRMQSPRYRGAIAEISAAIAGGDKMSDAMANHPDLFNEETLALVRAGEESGRLSDVLHQIANTQKKTVKILKKLKAGMIYPAIVLVMAVGVVIVMSFTLIPAISKLYASMNVSLPWATLMMVAFSNLLLQQPWMAAIPVMGLFYFFKKWGKIYSIPGVHHRTGRKRSPGPGFARLGVPGKIAGTRDAHGVDPEWQPGSGSGRGTRAGQRTGKKISRISGYRKVPGRVSPAAFAQRHGFFSKDRDSCVAPGAGFSAR